MLLAVGTSPSVMHAQSAQDSVVPAIMRGDLATAQRILDPLAAAGDAWAYANLGVVYSERARASSGRVRTAQYIESYAHFRAAELLGDTAATQDRREARAMFSTTDLPRADARVSALLTRHGADSLTRNPAHRAIASRAATTATPTDAAAQLSDADVMVLHAALTLPDSPWEHREQYVRKLAARPEGRAELANVLTREVFTGVAIGPPGHVGGMTIDPRYERPRMSYQTAERLGAFLCDVLSRYSAPSEQAARIVESAIRSVASYNATSPLIGHLKALSEAWAVRVARQPAIVRKTPPCPVTEKPSTSCLLMAISGFTEPSGTVSLSCTKQVSSMAAIGMVYELGRGFDEDNYQLAIRYCIDGHAFRFFSPYHAQLRRDAPRQYAQLEEAYRIASRLNLIFLR
jgi:hypothetical protein